MRSGNWRGVALGLGLVIGLFVAAGESTPAQAQFHTIPRLVPAEDLNTGGPYYAPPIPAGHYTGHDLVGKVGGLAHGFGHGGLGHCGVCGGAGAVGGCGACGAVKGCATCGGAGVSGQPVSSGGCGHAHGGNSGGCGLAHGGNSGGCGLAHGGKTGGCGHAHSGKTAGCGHDHGAGGAGSNGAISNGAANDGMCHNSACNGGCGLGHAGHGLGHAKGMVHHLLGHDKIKWFNGAGGPVPLTPGYVPYVNVTRSPRDFFAFPPFTPE